MIHKIKCKSAIISRFNKIFARFEYQHLAPDVLQKLEYEIGNELKHFAHERGFNLTSLPRVSVDQNDNSVILDFNGLDLNSKKWLESIF